MDTCCSSKKVKLYNTATMIAQYARLLLSAHLGEPNASNFGFILVNVKCTYDWENPLRAVNSATSLRGVSSDTHRGDNKV